MTPQTIPRGSYGVEYLHHNLPATLAADAKWVLWVSVRNTGTRPWQHNPGAGVRTDIALYIDDELHVMSPLSAHVAPMESVTTSIPFQPPPQLGTHRLRIELVEQRVAWFRDHKVSPLVVPFEVVSRTPLSEDPLASVATANPWFYSPSQLVRQSADGSTYPILIERAEGYICKTREGREFLDYVMGWGAALLGHANPRIRRVLAEAI